MFSIFLIESLIVELKSLHVNIALKILQLKSVNNSIITKMISLGKYKRFIKDVKIQKYVLFLKKIFIFNAIDTAIKNISIFLFHWEQK